MSTSIITSLRRLGARQLLALVACIATSGVFIVDYLRLPASNDLQKAAQSVQGRIGGFSRGKQTVAIYSTQGKRFDVRCQSIVEVCEGGYFGRQVSIDLIKVSTLGDYFGVMAEVDNTEVVSRRNALERYNRQVVSHLLQTAVIVLVTALVALYSRRKDQ